MRGVRAFKYGIPKGGFLSSIWREDKSRRVPAFTAVSPNPLSAAVFQQMPMRDTDGTPSSARRVLCMAPVSGRRRRQMDVSSPDDCARIQLQRGRHHRATSGAPCNSNRPGIARNRLPPCPSAPPLPPPGPDQGRVLTSHGAPDWVAKLSARPSPALSSKHDILVWKVPHFHLWTRRELARLVEDTLVHDSPRSLEAWFDMRKVARMVKDHLRSRANYTDELDALMTIAMSSRSLLGDKH